MARIPVFSLETPALRPVEILPIMHQGRPLLLVRDPMGVNENVVLLSPDPVLIIVLQTANGRLDVAEIATIARDQTGLIVTADKVRNIVRELDESLLLQSERFLAALEEMRKKYREQATRPSTVFISNDRLKMMKELGDELRRHSMSRNSPPAKLDLPSPNVRAILAPHIDYQRGGEAYAWAYKAIAEHTRATTFIILGTLHRPAMHTFIATRKSFETPLGTSEVDNEILDELEKEFGGELWEEEFQHASEHTVELQVVYLQHVLHERKFKIVPILVSTMDDFLMTDPPLQPREDDEIGAFIAALRKVMEKYGDRVALIGGVDFAHCGPEFGDQEQNTPDREREVRGEDEEMLAHIERLDAKGFFESFRPSMNERKVCSVGPIYTVLAALEGNHSAKVLTYQQANSPDKSCMVTFGGVAFTEKPKSRIILAS